MSARTGERRRELTRWVGWQALCAGVTGIFLVFMKLTAPAFFWVDDRQNQYLPVMRDVGRRLRDGEWLPLIDPNLAVSGNYAIDVQYGLFDPTRWLVAIGVSLEPNAQAATWWASSAYLLLLAAGVCALALRLGTPGTWAAACGFAAATSGFTFLWNSTLWIPGLIALTWLVWWWWALSARRASPGSLVGVAGFTYLTVAGGWPAVWVLALCLAIGFGLESWVRRDRTRPGADVWGPLASRVLAAAAGVTVAVVTVLPYLKAADFTRRKDEIENSNALVPNLADLFASTAPALNGEMNVFGGEFISTPVFFAAWFVPVVAWFVPWSRVLVRRPGMVAATTLGAISLLLTQAPSSLGPLRWPVRFVPGVHLALVVVGAVLLTRVPWTVNRGRCLGAALTVGFGTYLTWARQPVDPVWWTSGLSVAGCALLLVVLLRAAPRLAGIGALLGSVFLAGFVVQHHPESTGAWDYDVVTTRAPLSDVPLPSVALYPRGGEVGSWFDQGVGVGFSRLTATERVAPGYTSVGQQAWWDIVRGQSAHGYTGPASPSGLFTVEPRTGRPWIELMGLRSVVVYAGDARLRRFRRLADGAWEQTQRTRDFVVFEPSAPEVTEGRVTALLGDAEVHAVEVGRQTQSYQVATDGGSTLVFRDVFWPGYEATLDGEPVAVEPLGEALVSVEVPAGADGRLVLSYAPVSTRAVASLVVGAGLLLAAAVALAVGWPWRRRTPAGAREQATVSEGPESPRDA